MKNSASNDVVSALYLSSADKVNLDDVVLNKLPPTKEKRNEDDRVVSHSTPFFSLEMQKDPGDELEAVDKIPVPNMWSKEYIGLYCQYAAVGKSHSVRFLLLLMF
jgi:hypothetical protein